MLFDPKIFAPLVAALKENARETKRTREAVEYLIRQNMQLGQVFVDRQRERYGEE